MGVKYVLGKVAEYSTDFLKQNWPYMAGGIAGATVLYVGEPDISDVITDSTQYFHQSVKETGSLMLLMLASLLGVSSIGEKIRDRENKDNNGHID
ncbi:hypothetical protein KY349_04615 [Candidatus Woesearchaeota archaeon]|nr:hypothetical protein [Candidatus Woesearchaeota archaeon]